MYNCGDTRPCVSANIQTRRVWADHSKSFLTAKNRKGKNAECRRGFKVKLLSLRLSAHSLRYSAVKRNFATTFATHWIIDFRLIAITVATNCIPIRMTHRVWADYNWIDLTRDFKFLSFFKFQSVFICAICGRNYFFAFKTLTWWVQMINQNQRGFFFYCIARSGNCCKGSGKWNRRQERSTIAGADTYTPSRSPLPCFSVPTTVRRRLYRHIFCL